MNQRHWRVVLLFFLCTQLLSTALRECEEADFHYEYTECDKYGGRWRVAVPEPNRCVGGKPPPPIRGPDCSFVCSSGKYLDAAKQKCQPCPAGTYSLGGGIRYEQFDDRLGLPQGFRSLLESTPLKLLHNDDISRPEQMTCQNGTGWQVRGNTLTYMPGACLSLLTYSIKLVRPGVVKYKYLYPDAGVFFVFQVQNEQCVSVNDVSSGKHMFPSPTSDTTWLEEEVKLTSGQVLLSWKAMAMQGAHKPVKIKDIEIQGIAYAQECSKCPPGTYSLEEADSCLPCLAGHYSLAGAKVCSSCNNQTQYSAVRASKCEPRPPCAISDYYTLHGPCNKHGRSIIEYHWIQPKVCREDVEGAIDLPKFLHDIACPPCNPGSYMDRGRCHFCPKNHYSSGIGDCHECPPNTAPDRSYTFVWWNSMPEKLTSACQRIESGDCDSHEGWLALGDRAATTRSRDSDLYLTLTLPVNGFRSSASSSNVGSVAFILETRCSGDCAFYFIELPHNAKPLILGEWNGTVAKQSFTFQATHPNQTVFQWVFIKSQSVGDVSIDQAFIYSINVTNTVDGGASRCIQCPQNAVTQECIPCPPGHYIDSASGTCTQCPDGKYLAGEPNQGGQFACKPCGPNTVSDDGAQCITHCRLSFSNSSFDLTSLGQQFQAKGMEIFSRDGSRYYHLFNFRICGREKAVCNDTMLQADERQPAAISSSVCKVTVLPTLNETLFVNSIGLGSRLLGITDYLTKDFFPIPSNILDMKWHYPQLFFYYSTSTPTRGCAKGYQTLVIVRCDPSTRKAKATLPSVCPDGTCDGCLYLIILSARHACPICKSNDFTEIISQCVDGTQTVHRIPAKHCVLIGKDQDVSRTVRCSEISYRMQAAVGAATGLGFLLFVLTLVVWKKNQRLEYKYMKLVETTSGKDGLPAAESCALAVDEEDTTTIGVNRIIFLNKRKHKVGAHKNGFENVALASENNYSPT